MIHVLITSHGGMAEGMIESVNMLIGQVQNLDYMTFDSEMGVDALDELCQAKITNVDSENQYLILCDLKGGTPFNVISKYSFKNENIAVIYGMNLPILVEAVIKSGDPEVTLKELTDYLQQQIEFSIGLSDL